MGRKQSGFKGQATKQTRNGSSTEFAIEPSRKRVFVEVQSRREGRLRGMEAVGCDEGSAIRISSARGMKNEKKARASEEKIRRRIHADQEANRRQHPVAPDGCGPGRYQIRTVIFPV